MDFREASLHILQLAFSGNINAQESMVPESLVEEAMNQLPNIYKEVVRIIEDKNCEPDDKTCNEGCQRRTERSVKMLTAIMSSQTSSIAFQKLPTSKKIEKVIETFQAIKNNLEVKRKSEDADFFIGFFEGTND